MKAILPFVLVAIGGAIGSVFRYGCTLLCARYVLFPFATGLVNVLGSFLFGLIVSQCPSSSLIKMGVLSGFLGGFTTFSAFSYEFVDLWGKNGILALAYLFLSVLGGVLGVVIGLRVGG